MINKIRFPLTVVIFYISLIFLSFLGENIALLTLNPEKGMTFKSFFVLFVAAIILLAIYLYLEHRYNKLKTNFVILGILSIFFAICVFVIFSQPDTQVISSDVTGKSREVVFSARDKLLFSLQLFLSLAVAYIYLVPFKNRRYTAKLQAWMYWVYIAFALITIFVSFFTDNDVYLKYFELDATGITGIKSFYTNQNFYGFAMMLAVMCLIVIQIKRHRFYNTILMFLFFFGSFFSGCGATTLISLFIIILYYVFNLIFEFKKSVSRTLIKLFLIALLGSITAVILIYLYQKEVAVVKNSFNFCYEKYIDEGGHGFLSVYSRLPVWEAARKVIFDNPSSVVFGNGHKIGSWLMHVTFDVSYVRDLKDTDILSCHSTFFELWINYGLIGLILYYAVCADILVSLIYIFIKGDKRFAYGFFLCFLAFTLHGAVESSLFFAGNIKGLTSTLMFLVPVLQKRREYSHLGKVEAKNYRLLNNGEKLNYLNVAKTVLSSLLLIYVSIIVLFASRISYTKNNSLLLFSITISYFFIIPVITFILFSADKIKMHKLVTILIPLLVFFIVYISLFVLIVLNIKNEGVFGLIAIMTFILSTMYLFIFELITKVSIKAFWDELIRPVFLSVSVSFVISITLGALISFGLSFFLPNNLLSQLIIGSFVLSIILSIYLLIKNDEKKLIIMNINNAVMNVITTSF